MMNISNKPCQCRNTDYWADGLFVCLMVLNATVNIFQLHRGGQFYWWKKPEDPEKTTDLQAHKCGWVQLLNGLISFFSILSFSSLC